MWSEVVWQGVWYVPSLDPWGDDCQLRLWTFVSNATTLFVVTFFPTKVLSQLHLKKTKPLISWHKFRGRYSGFKVTGMIKGFFWVGKFGKVRIFWYSKQSEDSWPRSSANYVQPNLGSEIRNVIFWGLILDSGIIFWFCWDFLGFDFCTDSIIPVSCILK